MRNEKLLNLALIGFAGFILYSIWNRKGTVSVEAAGEVPLPGDGGLTLAQKKELLAARGFM